MDVVAERDAVRPAEVGGVELEGEGFEADAGVGDGVGLDGGGEAGDGSGCGVQYGAFDGEDAGEVFDVGGEGDGYVDQVVGLDDLVAYGELNDAGDAFEDDLFAEQGCQDAA